MRMTGQSDALGSFDPLGKIHVTHWIFFKLIFYTDNIYKVYKISYKIVPATNFTTYVLINKWKRIV